MSVLMKMAFVFLVLGGLLMTGPARAYTDDERQTLREFHSFDACRASKLAAMNPDDLAREIRDQAEQKNLRLDDDMIESMLLPVAQIKAGEACLADLGLDGDAFGARLDALERKYGAAVFSELPL